MSRYGDLDYEWFAKTGFVVSVTLFGVGAGAGLLAAAMHWSVPTWEETLFLDMEILGVVGMLFSPLVFGIVLPLTE